MRTMERWQKQGGLVDKRAGAVRVVGNQLSEEERQGVLSIANSVPYRDLPPSKIVPLLADEGRYIASESSFYRILRAAKQLTHRQLSRRARHRLPDPYTASAPNQVWSWDITYLPSGVRGQYYYLYVVMDIYSRKIVGWSIHDVQSADYAALLIAQACLDEGVCPNQLVLHSDNGSPMKGMTMLAMLETLGVIPSFSRPSVSDDNPYSEALFKTLKYHPTFLLTDRFATVEDARRWSEQFVTWYNGMHLHSGLKFVTPNQRHQGKDKGIFAQREQVYQLAKQRQPSRWSGKTRNWTLPDTVSLNSQRKKTHTAEQIQTHATEHRGTEPNKNFKHAA